MSGKPTSRRCRQPGRAGTGGCTAAAAAPRDAALAAPAFYPSKNSEFFASASCNDYSVFAPRRDWEAVPFRSRWVAGGGCASRLIAQPALPTEEEAAVTERTDTPSALGPALAERIGDKRYHLWFAEKTQFHWDADVLIVSVPNRFFQEWLQKTFTSAVAAAARDVSGRPATVRFVIDPSLFQTAGRELEKPEAEPAGAAHPSRPEPGGPESASELAAAPLAPSEPAATPAETYPRARPAARGGDAQRRPAQRRFKSLNDFQVGACNRLAHAAALNIIDAPQSVPNPVTLYGPTGVGKTHLLEGIYTELRKKLGETVLFLSAEEFTNRFLSALHNKQMIAFRRDFRHAAALLMDDFHFLANKGTTQEEFLYTFEALDRLVRPVVLTCACHPKMLPDLLPELADRLLGGGIWPLDPLDRETRLAILRAKIARLDCPLPEEAVKYLADNLHGNARELEGALHSVRHYAEVNRLPLTLPVVREATGQLVRFALRAVQIKDVEKVVCQLLELDAKALRSSSRAREISYPRMLAMYLARQHAGASFTEIGRYFGGRNHSTAVAADKKVRQWLAKDETLFLGDRRWKVKELLATAERELSQ